MLCTRCDRELEPVAAETIDGIAIVVRECPSCGRINEVMPARTAA